MSEEETVSELSDKLLSLLQMQVESLLTLRDEICKARGNTSDPRLQKDLDWLFNNAGEEIKRVQETHKRLGKTIRAPHPRISIVK